MRHLAEMYGVSLSTMQGALHALAALGFVQISHGVGVYVSRPRSLATTLVFACLEASPFELAAIRATIDERMPILAAQLVGSSHDGWLPASIRDLTYFAGERSHSRHDVAAETFVRADLRFHRAIVASVRGIEISTSVYEQIGRRLMPQLTATAASQARDRGLDQAHLALAATIIDGNTLATARLASAIARREAESVEPRLGDR